VLVVPNHHIIVPKTKDLSYKMLNTITNAGMIRLAQEQNTYMNNQNVLELSFTPISREWVEVYLDGYRVINPKYANKQAPGLPYEEYNISGNTVIFSNAVTGNVRVICDEVLKPESEYTSDLTKKGLVIPVINVQSYDIYDKRFTPDRKATGNVRNRFGSNVVSTLGLYNSHLTYRVGDSLCLIPSLSHNRQMAMSD